MTSIMAILAADVQNTEFSCLIPFCREIPVVMALRERQVERPAEVHDLESASCPLSTTI
jgi:hypothetical protein